MKEEKIHLIPIIDAPNHARASGLSTSGKCVHPGQTDATNSEPSRQSRWGYKTAEDIEHVVRGYRDHQIPLDMVYLDGHPYSCSHTDTPFC